MRVGHDVTVRVHDHARTHRVLAHDQRSLAPVAVATVQRPVSGGLNLNHRGRDFGSQILERGVHLSQDVRVIGGTRVERMRIGKTSARCGRLRLIRRLSGLRIACALLGKAESGRK